MVPHTIRNSESLHIFKVKLKPWIKWARKGVGDILLTATIISNSKVVVVIAFVGFHEM